MKLKYKKAILLSVMSTMGIGLLTLSVSHDKSNAKESGSSQVVSEAVYNVDTAVEDFAAGTVDDISMAVTMAPTIAPTPTPLPVYEIKEQGTYPEVDQLIKDYYVAKTNQDVDTLSSLLSDPSEADTKEELKKKTEYIDEYQNIKTYTKKGYQEGTYIVYAYHEIKFTSIKTPAPGLAKFYVITGADKKLKIFSGEMDEETQAYYDERNSDEDVIALIEMTENKADKAIKSDEDLHAFWKSIDDIAKKGSKKQSD